MDTMQAIRGRRSIRKFAAKPLPREAVLPLLEAVRAAPSAKNRQPWRLYVVTEARREDMIAAMKAGLDWYDAHIDAPEARQLLAGALQTLRIMAQAPVTVFFANPFGIPPDRPLAPYGERFVEMANVQSVGAAVENLCLAATAAGIGSLWIADIYQAYGPLNEFLGTDRPLVAAVSLGYPEEDPAPRPRMALAEMVTWL